MRNEGVAINRFAGLWMLLTTLATSCAHAQPIRDDWPEVPTVQQWLLEELRASRRSQAPEHDLPAKPRPAPSPPKPPAVELIAVYGTAQAWAVDVRIGGKIHILRSAGRDRADDARGQDSIVADRREGPCVRLRYRSTSRRLCLSSSAQERAS